MALFERRKQEKIPDREKKVDKKKEELGEKELSEKLEGKVTPEIESEEENERKINEIRPSVKDEEKQERVLEDCREGANLHIGTFGKAALKEGDLIPAIDAFDYTEEIQNPEITTELKEQMTKLKESEESEDRELLMKASERLVEISEKKEEEK